MFNVVNELFYIARRLLQLDPPGFNVRRVQDIVQDPQQQSSTLVGVFNQVRGVGIEGLCPE